MQEKQRKKLEGILNMEDVKKKRERLCNVLIQKLCVKYGMHHKIVIQALVDQFVVEKAQIAPDDLARLEKEVVVALKSQKIYAGNGRSNSTQSASEQISDNQELSKANSSEQALSNSASSNIDPPPPGSEWKVIQAYQILQGEENAREEVALAKRKKVLFKKALDDHIKNAKILKAKTEDKSDSIYFDNIKKDIQKYHDEEKSKAEKSHHKHQAQLQIQKQQIVDQKKRHEAEMQELRRIEDEMLADAQQKILDEANKIANNRLRAKAQQAVVDRDNEANQVIKDRQALKDADEDQRLMKEYAAKLDKDDFDRANAFNARMEKMALAGAKFETEGAGKAAKEEQVRMEQLLIKEQLKHEDEQKAKEDKKAHDKKIRLQKMLSENDKLIARKKGEEDSIRIQDKNYADLAMADVALFKKEGVDKKVKIHAHHLKYRKVLDDQMKNKPAQADPTSAAFLGREKEINNSLYKKAVHDKKVLQKLSSPPKAKVTQVKVVNHK